MKGLHKIYIFSDAVSSGKTTLLQQWLRNKTNDVAGVLVPDIDGCRKLYDIAKNRYFDFEVDGQLPDEEILQMGHMRFKKETYREAHKILCNVIEDDPQWVIVDEVGKLEVDDTGFEPALTEIVKHYKSEQSNGRLILVVRDYLLGSVVDKYDLNTDMILHRAFFE